MTAVPPGAHWPPTVLPHRRGGQAAPGSPPGPSGTGRSSAWSARAPYGSSGERHYSATDMARVHPHPRPAGAARVLPGRGAGGPRTPMTSTPSTGSGPSTAGAGDAPPPPPAAGGGHRGQRPAAGPARRHPGPASEPSAGAGRQARRLTELARRLGTADGAGPTRPTDRTRGRDRHDRAGDLTARKSRTSPGHGGDAIEAYLAQPLGGPPAGGVVVIHHMPGYDEATKEITRKFAAHGYLAVCPNLYCREAPGASPDDAAAAARAHGGVPDERLVGDVAGAAAHLRSLARSNGKVGDHRLLLGRAPVVPGRLQPRPRRRRRLLRRLRRATRPPRASRSKIGPSSDLAGTSRVPLLGLFGAEDQYPAPAEVAELETGAGRRRQGVRVPLLRGRGPRLLRHRPPELPARGGQGRLGADLGRSSAATWPA